MNFRKQMLKELQRKLNVYFKEESLLNTALTHSSYAKQKKHIKFNERLEFLGDSVLQICISEILFNNCKNKSEGELTKLRSLVVCENSLYKIALKWDLGKYMNMSKGEELTGGRNRVSILADCTEAIIAAIYLDKGYEEVKKFISINFENLIDKAIKNQIIFDYKTRLQEILQINGEVTILYNLVKYEGPPHRRKFYIEIEFDNKVIGKGIGYSKKEAEQNAAKNALENLEG